MKKIALVVLTIVISASGLAKIKKVKLPPKESERPAINLSDFKRVDPHGSAKIPLTQELLNQEKNCEVCHAGNNAKPSVAFAAESCMNCHNQRPHSGLIEHNKKDITCLSCHSSHRADAIEWQASQGRFSHLRIKNLGEGEEYRPSQHPMLKKYCTDCHKW